MDELLRIKERYLKIKDNQTPCNRRETMSRLVYPFLEILGYSNDDFDCLREEQNLNSIIVDYVIYHENSPKIAILGTELGEDVKIREKTIRELSKQINDIRLFVLTNGATYNLYCLKNGDISLLLEYNLINDDKDVFARVEKCLSKQNIPFINSSLLDELYKEKIKQVILNDVLGVSRSFIRFVRSSIGGNAPEEIIKKTISETLGLIDLSEISDKQSLKQTPLQIRILISQGKPTTLVLNQKEYHLSKWKDIYRRVIIFVDNHFDIDFSNVLIPSMYVNDLNQIPSYNKKEDYWLCQKGYYLTDKASKEVVIRTIDNIFRELNIDLNSFEVIEDNQLILRNQSSIETKEDNKFPRNLGIDDEWNGHKILGFTFLEKFYSVSTFIEMQLIITNLLVEKYGEGILYKHNDYFKFNKQGVLFKTINQNGRFYPISNTIFGLDSKNSSDEKRLSLRYLFELCSIPQTALIVLVSSIGEKTLDFDISWTSLTPVKLRYLDTNYSVNTFVELQLKIAEIVYASKGSQPFLDYNNAYSEKNQIFSFTPHSTLPSHRIPNTPFYFFTNTNSATKKNQLLNLVLLAGLNPNDFKITFK